MSDVATIGLALDFAKNVFQIHAVDAAGVVIQRRKLRRADVLHVFSSQPPCLVGMEACATSHYWAREIGRLGHDVRMMPPAFVKSCVEARESRLWGRPWPQCGRRADEAVCEAATRPTMRFVAVKTEHQQAVLVQHKAHELLVRQRTMLANACAHIWRNSTPSQRRARMGYFTQQPRC